MNFIALNDGSTINSIQVVTNPEEFNEELMKQITTGACLAINGKLVASQGSGQSKEIIAERIEVLGGADAEKYPLQPKKAFFRILEGNCSLETSNQHLWCNFQN